MEKICLTINDNKSRSIAFQVTEEEKEIDIHIFNYYYHFFTNNRYSDRYSLGV